MNICMFDELVVESGPHVVAEVLQDLDTATEVVNELRSKPDDQTDGVCQVVGETMIGKLPEVVENDNKVMESLLGRTLSHGELPAYVAENPGGEMGETDHDKAPGKNEGRARKRRLSIVWRASPEMAILRSPQSPSLCMVEASTSRKTARTSCRRAIERLIGVVGGKAVAVWY